MKLKLHFLNMFFLSFKKCTILQLHPLINTVVKQIALSHLVLANISDIGGESHIFKICHQIIISYNHLLKILHRLESFMSFWERFGSFYRVEWVFSRHSELNFPDLVIQWTTLLAAKHPNVHVLSKKRRNLSPIF